MLRYLVPLFIFAGLIVLFLFGLRNDPSLVPSPFIDKPVPSFELPSLRSPETRLSQEALKGEVSLLNIWATWCIPCRYEHPILVSAAENDNLRIFGLNYKDVREDAIAWLEELGDPYEQIFFDERGSVGIDLGVYGVPETFILDQDGIVRYKHVGPVTNEIMKDIILPIVRELKATSS
ncbi:MAG: DsbE family thiol:disulfide interchange protein [Gammaproteobacteria bacterium]